MSEQQFKIPVSESAAAVLRRLRTMPQWLVTSICNAMDKQNKLTITEIQTRYLSFPKDGPVVPIGCRAITGALRRSIWSFPPTAVGQQINSAIGSNLVYAPAQEFGFDGEVTVRPHMREHFRKETHFGRNRWIQKADIGVRSFTRHMHLSGRGFIRGGITRRLPEYSSALSNAIIDGWNKNQTK